MSLQLLGTKAKTLFPLRKISSVIPCSSFHVKTPPLLTKLQLLERSWQSKITSFFVCLTTTEAFLAPSCWNSAQTDLKRVSGSTQWNCNQRHESPPLTADSQRLFSRSTDRGLEEMSSSVQIFGFKVRNSAKWLLSATCWEKKLLMELHRHFMSNWWDSNKMQASSLVHYICRTARTKRPRPHIACMLVCLCVCVHSCVWPQLLTWWECIEGVKHKQPH